MAAEILFVRHAAAFDRDKRAWPDDAQRPLTPEGRQKFRKAAEGIARVVPSVELVLTSPTVRTRDTAALLTKIAGWPVAAECAELAPGQSAAAALRLLHKNENRQSIALIGHEPNLSELLSACIAGSDAEVAFDMKKGAIACVSFEGALRIGKGKLAWMLSPRVLREVR